MRRRAQLWAALAVLGGLLPLGQARADDAKTLPAGVARVRARPIFSLATDRWNQDGASERITQDLDRRNLNASVFPDLAQLEALYGLPERSLTLGTSHVQGTVTVMALALAAELGVSDRLSIGVIVPIVHGRHSLSRLSLDPVRVCDARRCGIGKNPGDYIISIEDSKYLPLEHDQDASTPLLAPVVEEDVQSILVDDLGYQRLADWAGTGIGDIELGLKYRILELGLYTTALQGGIRLPTGAIDDLNNLLDFGFGDGQTDLGLYWQNDFEPFDGFRLNATLRYTIQLPDRIVLRVPDAVDVPLTKPEAQTDVYRDLGDYLQIEAYVSYALLSVLKTFARYRMTLKAEDLVKNDQGEVYQSLIDETAQRDHVVEAGLVFSTLPWVEEKKYWLPLDVTLAYSRSVAGANNALIASVVSLEVAAYFEVFSP